jgi:hypothetical protein
MNVRSGVLVAAALMLGGTLPACKGPCAEVGNSIQVTVTGGADLNDAGAGAQHARFKVWAVKNAAAFKAQSAAALATGEVDAVAMNTIGRAFPSESNWLTPGGVKTVVLGIDLEEQYSHVGVAVLYPTAHKKLVQLCSGAAKKDEDAGTHSISFAAGKSQVE